MEVQENHITFLELSFDPLLISLLFHLMLSYLNILLEEVDDMFSIEESYVYYLHICVA